MPYSLAERDTSDAAWKALPAEQRQQFLGATGTAMGGLYRSSHAH